MISRHSKGISAGSGFTHGLGLFGLNTSIYITIHI